MKASSISRTSARTERRYTCAGRLERTIFFTGTRLLMGIQGERGLTNCRWGSQSSHSRVAPTSHGCLSDSANPCSGCSSHAESADTSSSAERRWSHSQCHADLGPSQALNLGVCLVVKVLFQSARETIPYTFMLYQSWDSRGTLFDAIFG